jgi:hypothetical protein
MQGTKENIPNFQRQTSAIFGNDFLIGTGFAGYKKRYILGAPHWIKVHTHTTYTHTHTHTPHTHTHTTYTHTHTHIYIYAVKPTVTLSL